MVSYQVSGRSHEARQGFAGGAVLAHALAGAVGVLTGCGGDETTAIVVSVDTDLSVPSEIDAIRMDVVGPDGRERFGLADLTQAELPVAIGIVHQRGPLSTLEVTIVGLVGNTVQVTRTGRTAFVSEQQKLMVLDLRRACVSVACDSGQTCVDGRCVTDTIDPAVLAPWVGGVPEDRRLGGSPPGDAGPPDGQLEN